MLETGIWKTWELVIRAKISVYLFAVTSLFLAVSLMSHGKEIDTYPGLTDAELLKLEREADDRCRGDSGDKPDTKKSCDKRDGLVGELKKRGWCYGRDGEYEFQKEWHKCQSSSIQSDKINSKQKQFYFLPLKNKPTDSEQFTQKKFTPEPGAQKSNGFDLYFQTLDRATFYCNNATMSVVANKISHGYSVFGQPDYEDKWLDGRKRTNECTELPPSKSFMVSVAVPVYLNNTYTIYWCVEVFSPSDRTGETKKFGWVPIDFIRFVPVR